MKMWSGRFRQPLDPDFERWQRSFSFDRRLLQYELAVAQRGACAGTERGAGVLSADELIRILQGLEQIRERAAASPAFLDDDGSGGRSSFRREATRRTDRRNGLQAAQRPQSQ